MWFNGTCSMRQSIDSLFMVLDQRLESLAEHEQKQLYERHDP